MSIRDIVNVEKIRNIIRQPRLLAYVLLAAGGCCCLICFVLFLGNKQPLPDLLPAEVMTLSTAGEGLMTENPATTLDQAPMNIAEITTQKEQVGSEENPNQDQLVNDSADWQGYTIGDEVDGFVVRSAPPSKDSGLYLQKPPEIVEPSYIEETPPPPPRPLDRNVMQSIVGIINNFNSKETIS